MTVPVEPSHAIAWCGFLGAWLLVAGPIYQAAIELDDEEFEREDLRRAAASTEPPDPISPWWLLLPPIAYVLRRRRQERQRREMLHLLSRQQLEGLMHFSETASAWLFVASGASLIAVKETWDLRETYGWSDLVFWALIALMIAVCVANTSVRIRRRAAIIAQAGD